MDTIMAITSIDGRYKKNTSKLENYFSEYGLFKYRTHIEIDYFIALCKELNIEDINQEYLNNIKKNFNKEECLKIKEIERTTNHDVKSVEIYIGNNFDEEKHKYKNLIHFGLTSQDINNVSISLSIKDYLHEIYFNNINQILELIKLKTQYWKDVVMISKTHGQSAVPTTMGKEFKVFLYRLEKELKNLKNLDIYSKFGGAVGNFNAHYLSYPNNDWVNFANKFLNNLGLKRNEFTTQIDNYESLSIIFDNIKRINTIFVDMCRDIWTYISMDYLKQKINKNEVGSSTMPQKVNPINFENAEGNLLMSINMLEFLSRKLPISRLQRDLTDSTILRNLGLVFGWCEVAYHNIKIGLEKINVNEEKIKEDSDNNISVLTEGYQTLLRKWGDQNAYDKLKEISRTNNKLTKEHFNNFIDLLDIDDDKKNELKSITVENYIGNSNKYLIDK
jgi:adenylosuccinate lyase